VYCRTVFNLNKGILIALHNINCSIVGITAECHHGLSHLKGLILLVEPNVYFEHSD